MSSRSKAFMLIVDLEDGEGRTYASADWSELDALTRLDCLRDWICDLGDQYDAAYGEFCEGLDGIRKGHLTVIDGGAK